MTINLRNLSADDHARAKAAAAMQKMSLQDFIVSALLEKTNKIVPPPAKKA